MKYLLTLGVAAILNVASAQAQIINGVPEGVGSPVVTIANNTDGVVAMLIGATNFTMAPHTASNYLGDRGAKTVQISVASIKDGQRIDKSYGLENGKHYSLEWSQDGVLDVFLINGPFGH